MKRTVLSIVLILFSVAASAAERKILVYTHNGVGYVHDNIPYSVAAIKKLGAENGFEVDSSDDPKVFTKDNLKQYRVLVFSNTNNEAFENQEQRDAFKAFIQGGGGLVGIHSAAGSERKWPYFTAVMGGKFVRHPQIQDFTIRVKDPSFPAVAHLPEHFTWNDECYFTENNNPDIKPVLVTDSAKLDDPKKDDHAGDKFGDAVPLAWYHTYDGGREFYTALGHKIEDYKNPMLLKQILGGILWAMGDAR
ncbi:MAG: ThuA domain-containing protein [Bryobacteraceae bacterium]